MNTQHIKSILLSLAATAWLVGCGGGASSVGDVKPDASSTTAGSVSAYVSKGPLTDSACSLYSAGDNQKLAGPVKSLNGKVDFPLPAGFRGVAFVECVGGTYTDESTGEQKTLDSLRGANTVEAGGKIVVTPLTELAMRKAKADLSDIADQAKKVANAVGLASVDILHTIPTDINTQKAEDTPSDQYGLVLASLSQLVKDESISADTTVNSVITALEKNLNDGQLHAYTARSLITAVAHLQQNSVVAKNVPASPPIPPMAGTPSEPISESNVAIEANAAAGALKAATSATGVNYSIVRGMTRGILLYNTNAVIKIHGSFTHNGSKMGLSVAGIACRVRSATSGEVSFNCPITNNRSITSTRIKAWGNFHPGIGYYYLTSSISPPPIIVSNSSMTNLTRGAAGPASFSLTGTGFYDGLTVSANGQTCQSHGTVNAAGTTMAGINCSNVVMPATGSSVAVAVSGSSKPATGNKLAINVALVNPPPATFHGWSRGNALTCTFGATCQNTVLANSCGATPASTYSIAPVDQAYATVNATNGVVTLKQITSKPITVTATQADVVGFCMGNTTSYQLSITTGTAGNVAFAIPAPAALTWNGAPQSLQNVATATCSNGGAYSPHISYSTSDSTHAPVDESTGQVTLNKVGTYTITAHASASGNCVAGSQSYTAVMNKGTPSLSFDSYSKTLTYGDTGTALSSPALGGIPADSTGAISYSCDYVNFSNGTDGCEVNNQGTLTITKPGSGTVTATLAEDANYLKAVKSYSLVVNRLQPVLTWATEPPQTLIPDTVVNTALMVGGIVGNAHTPSTDHALSYSSDAPNLASVDSAGNLTMHASRGSVTITASYAGDAYYAPSTLSYIVNEAGVCAASDYVSKTDTSVNITEDFSSATLNPHIWGVRAKTLQIANGVLTLKPGSDHFEDEIFTHTRFSRATDIVIEADITPSACDGYFVGGFGYTSNIIGEWASPDIVVTMHRSVLRIFANHIYRDTTYNWCEANVTKTVKFVIKAAGGADLYSKLATHTAYPVSPDVTIAADSYSTMNTGLFINFFSGDFYGSSFTIDNIRISGTAVVLLPGVLSSRVGNEQVVLSWNHTWDNSGGIYTVEYKPSNACSNWRKAVITSKNEVTINGLINNQSYDFRVRTAGSNELRTLSATPNPP